MAAAAHPAQLATCMTVASFLLSRRSKIFLLFLALFIFLTVVFHLAPSPPPSSCIPSLHSITFTTNSFSFTRSALSPCRLRPLSPSSASNLLTASHILIAGDSQARLLTLSLLRLLLDPASMDPVSSALFRRHTDYHILVPATSTTVDFVWAPYQTNLTDTVFGLAATARLYPDVLVLGSGLWHMLHSTNASDYGKELSTVRRSVSALAARSPETRMFWMGMPGLVEEKLNSDEKRERMNRTMWEAYDLEVKGSGLLRGSGGPMLLLDIGELSRRCGWRCTEDGMHYDPVVYEAALHILLNLLLIESPQRI